MPAICQQYYGCSLAELDQRVEAALPEARRWVARLHGVPWHPCDPERPEDPWLAARRRENEDYLERCRAQARVTTSHGAAEAHAPQHAPVSQDTVLNTDTVIKVAVSLHGKTGKFGVF